MRRLRRYEIARHKVLAIKYLHDNRYSKESISSHDHQMMSAISLKELKETTEQINFDEFSVIGVDEGQFFQDVVSFAEWWANNGKIIIISALDSTFQRQPFGDVLNLIPIAENVVKLSAICMKCYKNASFTKRKSEDQQLELIGGIEKYESLCRICYFKN